MKGNVFTIEALFGALLLIMAVAATTGYSNSLKENDFVAADELRAQDALIAMDRQGSLETSNATLIEQDLEQLLGNRADYRLELDTFGYIGGSFENMSQVSIGSTIPEGSEVAVAERSYLSQDSGKITNYTKARLYLWK
jgi:hypothetical protein